MEFKTSSDLRGMTIFELSSHLAFVRDYEKDIEKMIEEQKWEILVNRVESLKKMMEEFAMEGITLKITTPDNVIRIHPYDVGRGIVNIDAVIE